ncbi:MAG: Gfo/Idh/MocA family oxidoreductase [Actinomycetota bacterium]|nr:Gfo/Idh/MocA family oxidoreductase [Actinomycetota bacterium]
MSEKRTLGHGIIGAGWMGHVHARATARLAHHYPDLPARTTLVAVADTLPSHLETFVDQHGPIETTLDWRAVIEDPRVSVVSVTAPNAVHAEIGEAVARAGKHLWIEKPVGLNAADCARVATAVREAGVQAAVGFNYRNFPPVEHAQHLIRSGAIGTPTHATVRTLADYAADPVGTLSWRYTIAQGGHGILADLGSHGFDLIRMLLGDIDELVADTATFISKRPIAKPGASHFATADLNDPDLEFGAVENEDYICALLRMANGARVTYEAGRSSIGDQCNYGFHIHGTEGALSWDFRRSDELLLSVGGPYQGRPTQVVFGEPGIGEYQRFQPGAGVAIGYDDSKVIELARLLESIDAGAPVGATIEDALRAALANEAVLASLASGHWEPVA